MTAIIAFLVANLSVILGVVYAVLNVLTAVFEKNTKATGIISFIRRAIERLSALEPRNSKNTIKVPGRKAGPTVIMGA